MKFARRLILSATLFFVASSVQSQEIDGAAPSQKGLKRGSPGVEKSSRNERTRRVGEALPRIPAKAEPDKEPPKSGWSGFYLGINGGAARD